ncbi:sulfurtransferase complex subunit TusC [Halioxenophilus sp. WMMB6]|uniref:sulfurtransferase complex subunit TusC n=1 Tax=Halioxenophilus sp. WMMB6 TaxID=3073815 RepID=UPI00295F1336|nr:sulfurtransferase complex subunit TusC [Halioxenophilus sp. WMMB6]
MDDETKNCLLLVSHPPYSTRNGRDAIDVALTFGAFEMAITVLFKGDGVWQLLANQQSDSIGQKSIAKLITALPMYDIDDIYVCAESLAQRGIQVSDLAIAAQPLAADGIHQLLNNQFHILSF